MSNRHLVPMPTAKPQGPPPKAPRAKPSATAGTIVPSGLQTWHCFAFLIVAAVVWYFIKWPFIIIVTLVGFLWAVIWLGQRFPRTMFFIGVFMHTLFRR